MRQALFDEFQQIEWRARVEAIRERLDEQREQGQEQERANVENPLAAASKSEPSRCPNHKLY